jgi:hypothetical protein
VVMSSSWQTAGGQLGCHWHQTDETQPPYRSRWMQDGYGKGPQQASPLMLALDWTRVSPFAGKGWFERMLDGLLPDRPRQ